MALLALVAGGAATRAPTPPPIARLAFAEPKDEVALDDGGGRSASEGSAVTLGETVRVGRDAVARLELPWMTLTLGSDARLRFSDAFLLSVRLESGRALIASETHDCLKVVTGEAEVRGRGRAVVRRREHATLVTCLSGRFEVFSAKGSATLDPGQGIVALAGRPPGPPLATPEAPAVVWPGRDPVYVERGAPIELRWSGEAPSYHLELLPVGSDVVLLQRDVLASPERIEIPWHGAFRWRASALDHRGLEGPPSGEGLIAVE